MKFEEAITKISSITDLRRVARAHVIDQKHLSNEQLAAALLNLLHGPLGLARALLIDVQLQQYDTQLPIEETDARTIAFQHSIVDRSHELLDLACGDKTSPRYRDLEPYKFILGVAWGHQDDDFSPDEAHLSCASGSRSTGRNGAAN